MITERGKPIGQIVPFKVSMEERMQGMVAAGLAEWDEQKLKPYKPLAVNRGERQVSDLVVKERQWSHIWIRAWYRNHTSHLCTSLEGNTGNLNYHGGIRSGDLWQASKLAVLAVCPENLIS